MSVGMGLLKPIPHEIHHIEHKITSTRAKETVRVKNVVSLGLDEEKKVDFESSLVFFPPFFNQPIVSHLHDSVITIASVFFFNNFTHEYNVFLKKFCTST